MLKPSLEEVKALAVHYNRIPVMYTFSADHQTPILIYAALAKGGENSFILESVSNGSQWDRYSFIGVSPKQEIRIHGNTAEIRTGSHSEQQSVEEPIAFLKAQMAQYRAPVLPSAPNFTGGLIGYFGYDTVRYMEKKLTNVPEDDVHMPDCHLFLYDELVTYDHLSSNGIVILNLHTDGDLSAQYAAAQWRAEELVQIIQEYRPQPPEHRSSGMSVVHSNMTKEAYSDMVREAKEYIKNGDIFQIVLSQRFEITNPPDSFSVYRRLRATNPSPYLYYFHTPTYDVAGASPEMLVKVTNGVLHNRPIAGTKPRGRTTEEDAANEKALRADPKERAEHTMLVDLGRNDVGKVSEFGSVQVTRYMVTERASKVMHLVSDVEGKLRKDQTALDALMAVLPAGTLSGAPKVRAMELIDHFESKKRGLYGGTVGYLGFDGSMNTCIAIRTVLFANQKAYVQAGAGIVADSVPENEYYETVNKALAVINAIQEAE
ncbi:MAG: anthranilate synthase component I [Ruminococcus sp.]|nr:anthranilate synthase component I [Ruminococcus sp.]